MSVVLITNHDENIYSITSETHKPAEKPSPPQRISCIRKHQIPSVTTQRKELYATMGPAEYPPPDTRDYLKKKTWKPPMQKPSRIERDRTIRAAPIPRTADAIKEYEEKVKAATKKRNFIVENIKYALTMKPKEPQKRLVLDCHGDSKDINRGLEPQFLYSAVFGKTPKYLKRMVEGRERVVQLKKDITVAEKPKCRYITKEEREELLTVRKVAKVWLFCLLCLVSGFEEQLGGVAEALPGSAHTYRFYS